MKKSDLEQLGMVGLILLSTIVFSCATYLVSPAKTTVQVLSEDQVERSEPLDATYRTKNGPVWDMSQERAFIETLLGQRFNFFLIFFSIVVAGALNAHTQLHFKIILSLGTVICLAMASALHPSQEKLDLILEDLYSDPSHPATIVNKRAKGKSMRRLIGKWIPLVCCLTLLTGELLSLADVLIIAPK